MKDLGKKLGTRIKEVRKSRGLSQERLAEKVDISPRYLSRLEVGQQMPSIETLAGLAEALDVHLWELFTFGHDGTVKDLREAMRRLIQEGDEQQLRLAVKVFRAMLH
jgi:transcriptional regulator with XRE-family HTH domain